MDVSKNRGTPKSYHFHRVFHYKPSILGYPYFLETPKCFPLNGVFIPGSKIRVTSSSRIPCGSCVNGGGSSTRNITTVEDFFTGDNPCAKTRGVFLAGFSQTIMNHTLIQKTSKHTFQCLGLHEYENMFMIQFPSQHFGRFHLARPKRMAYIMLGSAGPEGGGEVHIL